MNPIQTAVKYFDDPASGLTRQTFPLVAGTSLATVSPGPEIDKKLKAVPTEVSLGELRFMYHFTNAIISGQHSVLEIGPLFGGSTRALAMGLYGNPGRKETTRVYTYDQFCSYYTKERHLDKIREAGALTPQIEREVMEGPEYPEFRRLFDLLHQDFDYYKLLDINTMSLPDKPEHQANMKLPIFVPPENEVFEYVMIDACKSWYSTKYFMSKILSHTPVGAVYHFQDYGWYSCFWLPVFTTIFREYFELVGFTHTSYVFRYVKELPVDKVLSEFPDRAEQFNADVFESIFDFKAREAAEYKDFFGLSHFILQKASALAYLGDRDKARVVIENLKKQPYAKPWLHHVDGALNSPTYHPPAEPSGFSQKVFL